VAIQSGALMIPIALVPLVLMIMGLFPGFLPRWVSICVIFPKSWVWLPPLPFSWLPIFYPIEVLPPAYGKLLVLNPITLPVILLRNLMLWDKPFLWGAWAISLVIGLLVCQIGYWWFQKSRRGFADVL
jgi:lipopolysaccharide transport system permease protein